MSSLFSKPKIPKEKPILQPDEQQLRRARRKSIARQQSRSGRTSTILSETEKLGY